MSEADTDTLGWIEARAVYARDHATGACIEQLFELSGPVGNTDAVIQTIADHTGRPTHSIQDVEIIAEGEREQIEETIDEAVMQEEA
jgi:hypothetical protein